MGERWPFLAAGGECGRLIAGLDWAGTPVGPIEDWPQSLRTAAGICLTSRHPMVIWWGPELALLYNDAWVPILGPSKHPAIGRPGAQVWPEMWHIVGTQMAGVLATGDATWSDDQLLPAHRHGYLEEAYFTYSYSPITAEDGTVAGVFTAVTETTERVLGARRLRILSELGDVSAVTAPTVEQACVAAVQVLARGRDDIPASSIYLLDGPDTARRVAFHGLLDDHRVCPPSVDRVRDAALPVWDVLASGQARELAGARADFGDAFVATDGPMGSAVPQVIVALPLAAAGGGEPLGVLFAAVSPFRALDGEYRRFLDLVAGGVATAIADARAYQAQLRRATELAELDRAKTEFFTGVSHELRTPLALISGPVEDSLADAVEPLGPRQRDRIEMVRRNSGRLHRLVDTLLEFSRLEGGNVAPERRPVDLAALTRGIAESFAPAVGRAGLEFAVDCADLGVAVSVDVDMWEKIVLNLLSNAVKYTPAGAVRISLGQDPEGRVELAVTDTGIGIAEADRPLLFRRFQRIRGARGRSHEGSGIGLALVAELAGLHGGRAEVDSAFGEGSTFTVTLPAESCARQETVDAQSSPAAARYRDEALQWSADPPARAADERAADERAADERAADERGSAERSFAERDSGTVLVAEDNADLRRFVAGLLAPQWRVLLAADGNQALELARTQRPDLVLTDVMMPGLDGFALLAALRADPATAATPVLMLSARAGEEASREGLAAGADDYLVKPFSSHDLVARVRSNLALGRLRNHHGQWRAALLDALLDGFFVIDADGVLVEMNDAMSTMLGFGRAGLPYRPPHPWWPDAEAEPELHKHLAGALEQAMGGGGHFVLPLRHRDGRHLWVECRAALAPSPTGGAPVMTGTMRDVTDIRRADRATALLAEVGRLQGRPGPLLERLTDVLRAAAPLLADAATVSLRRPNGWFGPSAAAVPDRPELAELLLGLPPTPLPGAYRDRYLAGAPFVVPAVPEDVLRGVALDEVDLARRRSVDARTVLVAPLVVGGRLLGSAAFASLGRERTHDDADLALAAELGRRLAVLVEADRVAVRESQLQRITAELAGAGGVADAARCVVEGAVEVFAAASAGVLLVRPGQAPEPVHLSGDAAVHLSGPGTPSGGCVDDAVWLPDDEEWARRYPGHDRGGLCALAVVPLRVGERCVGVLSVGFATTREFDPDEREFLATLAGQAAAAIERAALADVRREVAETLQHSLLPAALPPLDRIGLAARYLPASWGSRTGGDWYDVLALDEHRAAVVVGDVVGHGPAAAAVMGQLRSALAAYLLDGHPPAAAMARLDRFSHRVPGSRGSTALCLVLDIRDGGVRWARAGHPPPLVLGPAGADFLPDVTGVVLGVSGAPPYEEGRARLDPGGTVVLYTDGLVERRDELVDDGLGRLAAAAALHHDDPAADLIGVLLEHCLDENGPPDDVAVLVARLRPEPLELAGRARPTWLREVRSAVDGWARASALTTEMRENLQLAVGEAVANSVEHGYAGGADGSIDVRLTHRADGVHVRVSDRGRWRPVPADPGHRGRGLNIIAALADVVDVDTAGPGTRISFTVTPPVASPAAAPARARSAAPPGPGLRVDRHVDADGTVILRLSGELDLSTVDDVAAAAGHIVAAVRRPGRPVDDPGRSAAPAGPGAAARRGPVTTGPAVGSPPEPERAAGLVVDLREVSYLSSAGVGLLVDLRRMGRVSIIAAPGGSAARVLRLAGLDSTPDRR